MTPHFPTPVKNINSECCDAYVILLNDIVKASNLEELAQFIEASKVLYNEDLDKYFECYFNTQDRSFSLFQRISPGSKQIEEYPAIFTSESSLMEVLKKWAEDFPAYLAQSTPYAKGYKAGLIQGKEVLKTYLRLFGELNRKSDM